MKQKDNSNDSKGFKVWIIGIVGLIAFVLGVSNYQIINSFLDYRYEILDTTRYYGEHPLEDLHFKIPMIFDSDLRFPDFNESINIQTRGRLETVEDSLVDIVFDIEDGQFDEYSKGAYPLNSMFLNVELGNNAALYVNQQEPCCKLLYSLDSVGANDLPYFATQLLLDHVFVDEVEYYYRDSFAKLPFNETYVLESKNGYRNNLIGDLLRGTKCEITINIYLVAIGDKYDFDIEEIISKDINPWLSGLDDLFDFKLHVHHLDELDSENLSSQEEIPGVPSTLTDLPWIKEITKIPKKDDYDIKIIYYPYFQAGESIKSKSLDNEQLYHPEANKFITLENLGMVYFAHLPEDKIVYKENSKDFMWAFTKTILDVMGAPSGGLSFTLRTQSFKRVLIVDALTRYGKLLGGINRWLQNTRAIYDLEVLQLVAKTLEERANIIELIKKNDLNTSLVMSFHLVHQLNEIIDKKAIKMEFQ